MEQTWNDLLFAHWPVAPENLRPLVPPVLPLDTFNGQCWAAVTPFHMTGIRGRWMPPIPGTSSFPELNVRTYVNYGGKPGVFFFSLDAASRLAVWGARAAYHLPYFYARMKVRTEKDRVHYDSFRDRFSFASQEQSNTGLPSVIAFTRFFVVRCFGPKSIMKLGRCRTPKQKFPPILWPLPREFSCPRFRPYSISPRSLRF